MKSMILSSVLFCVALNLCCTSAVANQNDLKPKTISLSSGVKLEYVEKGSGRGKTIIFLHGFSDSWHSFEKIMTLMPATFHSIALSQRGHGNSSKPEKGYHPKDFAKDVADFIKTKKLGPCIIAGHSLGGIIAQQFALDYPELSKGLIIISSDAAFHDNPGLPEFKNEVMKLKGPVDYAFAEAFQKSTIANPVDSFSLEVWIAESMKLPEHVWHQTVEGIFSIDFTNELQSIVAPVLIFWGTKDGICFEEDQQKFTQNLKNSKLIKYEGTGHALHWEEPERFVSDVVNNINVQF